MLEALLLLLATPLLFVLGVRKKDIRPPVPVSPATHVEERKAAIYENLRDLQFEFRVGKLSETDYQSTKASLQKELAAVVAGTASRITRCGSCGAQPPRRMKFCGNCGSALS